MKRSKLCSIMQKISTGIQITLQKLQMMHEAVIVQTTIGKGKVHHRTGHEGPEGEQRYSSTLSLTSVLDGGGWSTPHPGRFTPGNDPVPIVQEDGLTPGPAWTDVENLAPTRDSIPGPSSL
jgi:hypothetical protein